VRQTHRKGRAAPHARPDRTTVPPPHRRRALPGTHPPASQPRVDGTASSSVRPWQCQQVACAAGAHLRHVCHAGIFRWKSEPRLCQSVAVRSASGLQRFGLCVGLGLRHVVALERTWSRTHHSAARASHGWQMMQEMTRHPRHLGMELVEHKLHLQRLLWQLMRRCTTSPSRGWWDPWPNSHGARCSGTLRRTARSTAAS
jgi:hypothetical protein